AKRTVTSLRSAMVRSPIAAPQAGQKRAPAGTAAAQFGHPPSTATLEAYIGIRLRSTSTEMNSRSPSYRSMPLSAIQKGAIGQFAFLAIALVTGQIGRASCRERGELADGARVLRGKRS